MNNTLKHILFIPRWYPHKFDPMFGLFVKKHAEAVAKLNRVSVLYVQGVSTYEKIDRKQTTETHNLFTQIYYYRNSNCKIWNILRFWYYLIVGFLKIKKAKGKPNLVHVHILTRLGIFALLIKSIYNTPYIITEHWSRYLPVTGSYKGWSRKLLTKLVVKKASAVLPVSKTLSQAMQSQGLNNQNYHIVPNVIEDIFFQPIKNKEKNQTTIFLHVSTFEDKSKNISGILRVIKQLSEKKFDFEFWFVGDGIDFKAMKNYAKVLSIPENIIRFYGVVEGEKLAEKYHKADYLVMFSNYETFLIVFFEAMACGLAVITTKVGELAQYSNESNGFLIEPGNEKQLKSTLENVLVNKPYFNPLEIKKVSIGYDSASISKRLDNIYNNCI